MVRTTLAALACLLSACAQVAERGADAPRRIVSLDYCADQYVLKFADREDILALSPDAGKRFSYMRAAAEGIPTVRPRTGIRVYRPTMKICVKMSDEIMSESVECVLGTGTC